VENAKTKKELREQYKEREIIGGVYLIRNTRNGRILLEAAPDLGSAKNRFEFAQNTGSCVHMILQKDWSEHGCAAFSFEVLEELKKLDTQTKEEFKADVELLKEIWTEKYSNEELY